jgi:hypothetical protein
MEAAYAQVEEVVPSSLQAELVALRSLPLEWNRQASWRRNPSSGPLRKAVLALRPRQRRVPGRLVGCDQSRTAGTQGRGRIGGLELANLSVLFLEETADKTWALRSCISTRTDCSVSGETFICQSPAPHIAGVRFFSASVERP